MKLLLFLSTAAAASNYSLCADWQQLSAGRCTLNTKCCTSAMYPNSSVPQCNTNPPTVDTTVSIISQETYTVAGDGTYAVELLYATGNSCPLAANSGTVLFRHVTTGTYTVVGSNDVPGNWTKVQYNPQSFSTTVVKTNQGAPFTAGVFNEVANETVSPCMNLQDYLNSPTVGCQCNGTWTVGGPRMINTSSCPLLNSTMGNSTMGNSTMGNSTNSSMSTCPENNFFRTNPKYGNVRVTNTSDTSCVGGNNANNTNGTYSSCRVLEVTQPMWNSTLGYNNTIVYASFIANQTCPGTLNDTNTMAPTAHYSAAGRATVNAVFSLAAAWGLVLAL